MKQVRSDRVGSLKYRQDAMIHDVRFEIATAAPDRGFRCRGRRIQHRQRHRLVSAGVDAGTFPLPTGVIIVARQPLQHRAGRALARRTRAIVRGDRHVRSCAASRGCSFRRDFRLPSFADGCRSVRLGGRPYFAVPALSPNGNLVLRALLIGAASLAASRMCFGACPVSLPPRRAWRRVSASEGTGDGKPSIAAARLHHRGHRSAPDADGRRRPARHSGRRSAGPGRAKRGIAVAAADLRHAAGVGDHPALEHVSGVRCSAAR